MSSGGLQAQAGGRPGPRGESAGRARLLPAALRELWRAAPRALSAKLLCALTAGLAPVVVAWLTKLVVNRLVERPIGPTAAPLAALCALGAAVAAAQYLGRYADRELSRRATEIGMTELFGAVVAPVGIAELEDPGFQDRLKLAQQATTGGMTQLLQAVLGALQPAVTAIGFCLALWSVSPLTTLLVLLSAVPAVAAQLMLSGRRVDVQARMSPMLRRQVFYTTLILDPRAATEMRLFGLGTLFRGRLLGEVRASQQGERSVDKLTLRTDTALGLLTAAVSTVALFATVARIRAGHATIGDLALITAALAGMQGALASVVVQIGNVGPALALYGHYHAIVGAAASSAAHGPGAAAGPLCEGLELRDVWFRYHPDHDWVLRGVNLVIPAGRSLALVGLNGAGKSTLVKLLCRMYEPERGTITWDGTDIRDLDPVALRRRIGVLFQDYMTYQLTAADNIAVGEVSTLDASDPQGPERLRAAARAAGVHEVIESLPQGYDTMLGRVFAAAPAALTTARGTRAVPPGEARAGGVSLSGGQWQRVALARALLRRDADLLILDEPSSGVDAAAEREIHGKLAELRAGRTSLLISHRLAAVRQADVIAVLGAGTVVELGDHDTLMAADGGYAALFRTQAEGYQLVTSERGEDDR
ncbi:ABC transporter ATP-binding protein [Actinospica robiniae]|uniref:ABC transporter ATP-binding protein n=1 Tax=Actinospica robiniae TaxID=304901 RepID=UPI00040AB668|nr:ABC transporter ATP-binding protein [Actinospica robiniae]